MVEQQPPSAPGVRQVCLTIACSSAMLWLWLLITGAIPSSYARELRPVPDAAEHVHLLLTIPWGDSPLMPIGHELHPSRFSPVMAWVAAPWMWMAGRHVEAAIAWSGVAALLTCIIWPLALLRLGVAWPLCALASWFLPLAPALHHMASEPMQETTLMLLLATSMLAMPWPTHHAARNGLPTPCAMALVAGFLAGLAAAMRLTLAPFAGLLVLLVIAHEPTCRRKMAIAGALTLGAITAFVGVGWHHAHHTGQWYLAGYFHWIPDFRPFSPVAAFAPPANLPLERWPQVILTLRDALGQPPGAGVPGILTAGLIALAAAVTLWPAQIRRHHGWMMALFAASQVAAHAFYTYYDARFLLPAWMLLLTATALTVQGIIDDRRLNLQWAARNSRLGRAGLMAMVLITAGLPVITMAWRHINTIRQSARSAHLQRASPSALLHPAWNAWVNAAPQVIFVQGAGVLNARHLLQLHTGWQHPIFQAAPVTELYDDGHMVQFLWYRVRPPVARLAWGASCAAMPAHEVTLINHDGSLNMPVVHCLRAAGGFTLITIGQQAQPPTATIGLQKLQSALGPSWHIEERRQPPVQAVRFTRAPTSHPPLDHHDSPRAATPAATLTSP